MRRILLALFAALPSASIAATPPQPPSCKSAEYSQLDFWLGDWHAAWTGGEGSNHITKTYENCVVEEHFDGRPGGHLQGHSVSTYFAPRKKWRQTWVDNEGGYIDLCGGPDGKGNFVLTTLPVAGSSKASRMIFTDIKPDSFTWRWQGTKDGKAWEDSWVIHYTRKMA